MRRASGRFCRTVARNGCSWTAVCWRARGAPWRATASQIHAPFRHRAEPGSPVEEPAGKLRRHRLGEILDRAERGDPPPPRAVSPEDEGRIAEDSAIGTSQRGPALFALPLLIAEGKHWFWIFGVPLGLFATSGKLTALAGPALVAWVSATIGSQRHGIAVIVGLPVAGGLLPYRVREPGPPARGRKPPARTARSVPSRQRANDPAFDPPPAILAPAGSAPGATLHREPDGQPIVPTRRGSDRTKFQRARPVSTYREMEAACQAKIRS